MKPFLRTSIALAVAAGLAAYIYFVERKRPATSDKAKEKVFAQLDRKKVKEIFLSPAGGETIRLVRSGDAWKMTQPSAVPAATSEVEALLSSLENLQVDEVIADAGTDLGQYGLAPAHSTVGVTVEGASEPIKLELGAKTPDDAGLYAKLPSAPRVFTVASYVDSTFNKKPFDLRDRDILHVKRDEVAALDLSGPQGALALARSGPDGWTFTQPLRTLAGRFSIDSLIDSLESLRMDAVAAESVDAKDLKRFGLAPPARVVTLGLKSGQKKALEIGSSAPDDKYYARLAGSPLVAVIGKTLVDNLAKGMSDLRAKRLLDVFAFDVEGFDVEAGGVKKTYVRSTIKDKEGFDANKWKRTAPDNKDLEADKVQEALSKIGGIEVAEFIDKPAGPEAYGLEQPELKVSLRLVQGKGSASFDVGQKDGNYYARRPNDDAILKLDKAKAEDLVKAFKGL